jgi:hypothetical protein
MASFPYVQVDPALGLAGAMPYVSIELEHRGATVSVQALVDSGAALNVLPYTLGLQLGFVWDQQRLPIKLGGNLLATDARAILVIGRLSTFPPVRLAFAWAYTDQVPTILGQTNFFFEYDVIFRRRQLTFEINLRAVP